MLHIISVWGHILAAMVWIGGMAFLTLVLVPALQTIDNTALRSEVLKRIARRFRLVAWASILLLIGTGVTNLMLGTQWPNFQTTYGRLLICKLIAVGLMGFLTAFHEVTVSKGLRVSVGLTKWVPRAALVLGLVVILFAVALVRV